ncbi:hypothetical protein [Mesorhizobium sp. M2E.F.Ca.ET.166.01.1.1]|uniref:hypothetical protein n=1 Tax=Mesorhizobium sp. M2E.F.Ca.ET.166.01.1.1 TaxID=2500523 RepID=UPI000FDC4825|nr:hypothetical protein [Mesorhizobium sp. M2E.F.Ca.ET.166.01.1.1]TGT76165.1 hypothetical protein EN809_000635 [Mesorhizobium sp. M2E.F.Ca.ET.166.01.1.1]
MLAFVIFAFPALAQECTPVVALKRHAVDELHVATDNVFVVKGHAEALKYMAEVGAEATPSDSSPKGLFVVEGVAIAYVGIIEENDCVRYSMAVPLPIHAQALAKVMKGA